MREPTTEAAALAWHRKALEQRENHLQIDVINGEPQCGWFECRMTRGGPLLPAHIWIEDDIDDAGELVDEPKFKCQVVYIEKDPLEWWERLCGRPISQERYDYLMELGDWVAEWEPRNPFNEPKKRVDARDIPMPTF